MHGVLDTYFSNIFLSVPFITGRLSNDDLTCHVE